MWLQNGFSQGDPNIPAFMKHLEKMIEMIPAIFQKFSKSELLDKLSAEKWSKQEILGHLVDSAIYNLNRFNEVQVAAQPFIIKSYPQNDLVLLNNYQQLSLAHILKLWTALNTQILYVVDNIPIEKFSHTVKTQYETGELKTLAWIICDYVAHMVHHLDQITK